MVKLLKLKIVPVLVSVVLALSPLALSVSAAVWEGSANIGFTYWNAYGVPFWNGVDVVLPVTGVIREEARAQLTTNGMRLNLGEFEFTSPVSIYINGYYRNSHSGASISVVGDPWEPSNYEVQYTYDNSNVVNQPISGMSEFTPVDDASMAYVGEGVGLYAKVDASDAHPVKNILVRPVSECGWKRGGANSLKGYWFWTSVRVISAETSAELDELNNVANQIIAGNEILEAMKGDIVALLQQIYIQTGDIEIALTQTNTLLNSLLRYVDGLEGQIADFYSTFSSFTAELINLLQLNNKALIDALNANHSELMDILYHIDALLADGDGTVSDDVEDTEIIVDGTLGGLDELEKPDFSGEDLEVDGYSPDGNVDYLGNVLAPIFGNSLFFSMLMVTMTFCLVAYVLYGKR